MELGEFVSIQLTYPKRKKVRNYNNLKGVLINIDTDMSTDIDNDELILVTDEMTDIPDTDDEAEVAYDLQPTSIEEVQAWIDSMMKAFAQAGGTDDLPAALAAMDAAKPRWELEVDESLIPDGWYCAEAEDDNGALLYWTLFEEIEIISMEENTEDIYYSFSWVGESQPSGQCT